jgi:molybdopterin-containing oxidoreductase family molybdopterin binding subunit
MGAGCHEGCILKTYVKNDRIIRTERVNLTGPEKNCHGICQKGIEYARFNDCPERLLYPLKRTGERGEGKWERISWDQAIDEISETLCRIRDTHGPQAVLVAANPSGYPNLSFSLLPQMNTRFIHTFDASASQLNAFDTGFFGSEAVDFGSGFIYGGSDKRLMAKARHLIIWGSNAIGNTRAASTTRYILDAQENGAKLVHIGVVFNSTAAKCDQFVAVKRGSDAALALAMARYMIENDGYDIEYVRNQTVAPLLVRDDTGMFLRETDYDPSEGMETNYVGWDEDEDAPVVIPAHTHEPLNYKLTGAVTINGIPCKPAFQLLVDHIDKWTPEYQEQYTGVPADMMRQITEEYMTIKPADIYLEECLRYQNGLQSYRAIHLLAALSGNLALEGGGLTILGSGLGFPSGFNNAHISIPEGIENVKGRYIYPSEAFAAAEAKESPFKAFLCFMGNPMHSNPGRETWKKLLDKMELIVVHDLWESDTGNYADYLLPDTTTFERTEMIISDNHLVLLEPAVKCKGEQKTGTEVLSLIGRSVGLGHLFEKTDLEYHELRLQSNSPAIAKADPPITMERLKKEKMIRLAPPDGYYNPLRKGDFMTETGRIEFYNEDYVCVGMPMAEVRPIFSDAQPAEELDANPLHLFVGRARLFMQTTPFMIMPDLLALSQKEPWAWVNEADAIKRGVNDGDLIRVTNTRGSAVVRAKLTQAVPPGMVNMWLNYRVREYQEGGPTYLQRMTGAEETVDDFSRRWQEVSIRRWGLAENEQPSMEAAMRGKMPAVMNWESTICGNYDVIWDNRCNFAKA